MKVLKIISVCVMAMLMIAVSSVTLYAADVEAGKTVTVSFSVPSTAGVDGYFEYSDKSIFSGISYQNKSSLAGDIANDRVFLYGSNLTDVVIEITLTVKDKAAAGDKCQITFSYEYSDADGQMSDWKSQSQTVTVKAPKADTTAAPTPETTAPAPETTRPEVPSTTAPDGPSIPDEPIVTEVPGVDYTELIRQINIVRSLNENEYSVESWDAMVKAYNIANSQTSSRNQNDVDSAAAALERAIGELVKVDYEDLRHAIDAANALGDAPAHGELWAKLYDAIARSEAVLSGRDQGDADALAKEINDLINEIKKDGESLGGKVIEVEKQVEVLPEGEYCNKHLHTVRLWLLIISAVINLALIGLIIWFLLKRKKNQKDDTPLVDYDIGDDE